MKVKFTGKIDRELFSEELKIRYPASYDCQLKTDQSYTVYAIAQIQEFIGFLIFEPNELGFPLFFPSIFFDVIDPRLSRFWMCSLAKKGLFPVLITYKEWSLDREFYNRVTQNYFEDIDYEEDEKLFYDHLKKMDLEFPDEAVVDNAQIGDETWLICPKCMDAWEYPDNKDALVVCPKCYLKYNNPRYVNEYPLLLNKNYDFL